MSSGGEETFISHLVELRDRLLRIIAATLLVYFDSNQNAKLAAQRLGIHVNTMRQRLGTIEDRVGYWGHATRALELHIALRLWSLSGPAQRTPPDAQPG